MNSTPGVSHQEPAQLKHAPRTPECVADPAHGLVLRRDALAFQLKLLLPSTQNRFANTVVVPELCAVEQTRFNDGKSCLHSPQGRNTGNRSGFGMPLEAK